MGRRWIAAAAVWISAASAAQAWETSAGWPQFRGPTGDGRAVRIEHPLEWSGEKNLAWKAVLPGQGWSSPVVIGDKVFVTTASADGQPKPKSAQSGSMDPRSNPLFGGGKAPDKV